MSTLANAMDVLKLMARLRRDITVTDVATELGLPKSSVSRTLSMMAEYGFLDRDPVTRAYRPGGLIMEASYHFRASRNASSLLEDELDVLVRDTGYTGYINVLDGADSMVVQMRTGTGGALQVYTPVGTRAPAYSTSMGRAILARLTDDEVNQLIGSRLDVRRGDIPRTRKDLLERLATIRTQGWALSRGEFVPNVAGISAAVVDAGSRKVYGIGIGLPAQDLTEDLIRRFGRRVRDAAMTVGKRIGDAYWLDFAAEAEPASSKRA
ncbi:IclR family transcriptional regulator [Variovorax dokdonensis]|uniref:IclR family transcriptional regulator n=1 Tax=Variovorax dokdonensis TaxID=344883 RepID=A0ABT7NE03_9BURK|nr:IclR family transcriptional regulator [Variovorax dokdonensis]MDM0046184.1 IclR family transcriptional regulator [Variovorax dokdonensis]